MAKHGKKYTDATTRFDPQQLHTSPEAVDLVKSLASAKFDETVELAVRLGVDPRKADQMIRGTVGPAVRHRQATSGSRSSPRATPPPRPARRVPTSSAPTTSSPRSRAACSTSTWPSRRPTSCPRWASWAARSAPVASCPTPRPAPSPPTWARPSTDFKGGKVEYRTDRHGNVHVPIGKVSFEVAGPDRQPPGRARRARAGQAGRCQGSLLPAGRAGVDHGPERADRHPAHARHRRRPPPPRSPALGGGGVRPLPSLPFRPAPAGHHNRIRSPQTSGALRA